MILDAFRRQYGDAGGVRVFRAPGRVNLIGEHTDYNLGFVLPIALDLACYVAAADAPDGVLRVYSEEKRESREWSARDIGSLEPSHDWSDYVAGVARELVRADYHITPKSLLIRSTVPEGSGLSSSAALEVSSALALLGNQTMAPLSLAQLCRRAEVGFVGMPCGIMDQYVSVFAREHAALQIDCRSLESQDVELPDAIEIIAVNSMVKHALGQSAYKQRTEECAAAVEMLRRLDPMVSSLRDVTVALLETAAPSMPHAIARRARHVVTENERVGLFVGASRRGDLELMGRLMVESHASLRHDYEVSCPELDFLVDTAMGITGVLGARMTGGGFGGCTVNLLRRGAGERFRHEISSTYGQRFGVIPRIFNCHPSGGAGEVKNFEKSSFEAALLR
ncbi:MAG TPA: galactokinase [Bryobacteraceae bacterium]|nr:galactokinase [Bryobacteraceae bacterium]